MTTDESHQGELAACDRDDAITKRISTGLGSEVDAALFRVLARLDQISAGRVWSVVESGDRAGELHRTANWIRAMDQASSNEALGLLVAAGWKARPWT